MSKPDFDTCTTLATELLLKQDITFNRILNIRTLNYDKSIVFESIQNYCKITKSKLSTFLSESNQTLKDGCTLFDRETNTYIVLFNADITNFKHLNWTLAHEIGHIYLGHTQDAQNEEIEAHYFAAQLFMPEYTLYKIAHDIQPLYINDLVEIFGVSNEAASRRLDTMNRKTMISCSQSDKEIWERQKKRVQLYYEAYKRGYDYGNLLDFEQYLYDITSNPIEAFM